MTIEIPLTKGYVALIDDEDYPLVSKYTWYAKVGKCTVYAGTTETIDGKLKHKVLHRMLLNAKPNQRVDHRNHIGTDCQRHNLRICTIGNNNQNAVRRSDNTSGYKGVSFDKTKGLWKADIYKDKQLHRQGYFNSPEEAAEAYLKAAKELHGEFHCVEERPKISAHRAGHAKTIPRKHKDNSTGYVGVLKLKLKNGDPVWVGKIMIKGKQIYLGRYKTPEGAYAARVAAEIKYGFREEPK